MNKNNQNKINQLLNEQVQMDPPKDMFGDIMDQVHARHKSRYLLLIPAIAVSMLMIFGLVMFKNTGGSLQGSDLFRLEQKIAQIETYVLNDYVRHSGPGSEVLEKMVSMENWLDQLNRSIADATDNDQKLELMHAKLDILGDLVALQRKLRPQSYSNNVI